MALNKTRNSTTEITLSDVIRDNTDSSLLGYTASGTGAVTDRTVQDKLRETVSVKDFGAKGDGVTDDTVAIQTAVATYKSLVIPSGTYITTDNITFVGSVTFTSGAVLSVASGKTILFSGGVNASPEQTIFTGSGTITGLQESYPDWFGAVANGSTDDSAAINKAIVATSGIVWFREDVQGYKVTSPLTLNKSITLDGINRALLICDASIDLFEVLSNDVTVQNFRIDGDAATPPNLFHINTGTTSIERLFVSNLLTINCKRLAYDDNHATNTAISLYFEDVQCRFVRERSVLLYDAFAFIFFTRVTFDYTTVTDAATNIPVFSVVNNQGMICQDVDILGGTITGMSNRWGFNVEDSAAVFFLRCNADTLGGYGFRIVNVESCRLDTTTASLCDQHGYLIAGTTFDLQGSNVYAGGRNGLGGTASQHGIYVLDSANNINMSNVTLKNNTGDGIATGGTSGTFFSGVVSHNNVSRGINLGGTTSLVAGARLVSNGVGNYNLTGANHHLTSAQLNSGALVVNATGPVSA